MATPMRNPHKVDPRESSSIKSHISHSSTECSSKISMKLRQCAQAREIELAAQLMVAKEQNLLEERKRQLESKLNEEEAKLEEDEGLRRAQELIRDSQERAARIRRRQELANEKDEIKQKQEQIKLEAEYKAAKEINLLYKQQESGSESDALSRISMETDSIENVQKWLDSTTQHTVINKHHVSSSVKKDDKSDLAQRSEQLPQIKMTTNLQSLSSGDIAKQPKSELRARRDDKQSESTVRVHQQTYQLSTTCSIAGVTTQNQIGTSMSLAPRQAQIGVQGETMYILTQQANKHGNQFVTGSTGKVTKMVDNKLPLALPPNLQINNLNIVIQGTGVVTKFLQ